MSEPTERKTVWCYVTQCRYCKREVAVVADGGVRPAAPVGTFTTSCTHCHLPIEFREEMLTERRL